MRGTHVLRGELSRGTTLCKNVAPLPYFCASTSGLTFPCE
jgi:hypothetical protein